MKKLSLLLIVFMMASCQEINLGDVLSKKDAKVQVNTTPAITDSNVSSYTLNGSCASDVEKIHVKVNGTDNSVDCLSNTWNINLDMSGEPNGSVALVISFEKNATITDVESTFVSKNADIAPTTNDFTAASFNEEASSTITLSYSDADGDQASSCSVSGSSNLGLSACSCSSGTCSVTLNPVTNYFGSSSFSYTVTANSKVSNSSIVSVEINNVNDAPNTSVTSCNSAEKGVAYSCSMSAYKDTPSEVITWQLDASNTCSFASINASTGEVTGTPSSSGTCQLALKATDDGGLSYVASGSLSIAHNPVVVSRTLLNGGEQGKDLVIAGNYAYVWVDKASFQIFDITNKASPVYIKQFDTGSNYLYGMAFKGNYLYYADPYIKALDISDRENPVAVTFPGGQYIHSLAISGDYLIGHRSSDVKVYDISTEGSVPLLKQVAFSSSYGSMYVRPLSVDGDNIYIPGGYAGYVRMSLSEILADSAQSYAYDGTNYVYNLLGNGSTVYVADRQYVRAFDNNVAAPSTSAQLDYVTLPVSSINHSYMGIVGDKLFVSPRDGKMYLYDISNTSDIKLLGKSDITNIGPWGWSVAKQNSTYMYQVGTELIIYSL